MTRTEGPIKWRHYTRENNFRVKDGNDRQVAARGSGRRDRTDIQCRARQRDCKGEIRPPGILCCFGRQRLRIFPQSAAGFAALAGLRAGDVACPFAVARSDGSLPLERRTPSRAGQKDGRPVNAGDKAKHREEITRFAKDVAGDKVAFVSCW